MDLHQANGAKRAWFVRFVCPACTISTELEHLTHSYHDLASTQSSCYSVTQICRRWTVAWMFVASLAVGSDTAAGAACVRCGFSCIYLSVLLSIYLSIYFPYICYIYMCTQFRGWRAHSYMESVTLPVECLSVFSLSPQRCRFAHLTYFAHSILYRLVKQQYT